MRAKAVIRTAIAVPACALIVVTTLIAPEFAHCEPWPIDEEVHYSYVILEPACVHSAGEFAFTWTILSLAIVAVAVIVSTGADSRKVIAGSFASASSSLLAIIIIQTLHLVLAGQLLGRPFQIVMLVAFVASAAIGGVASWAANRQWRVAQGS